MKKNTFGRKFSRDTTSRRAMYRALVRSFFTNRSLTTTNAKASVAVPIIEKLIVQSKSKSLAKRRKLYAFVGNDRQTLEKIIDLTKVLKPAVGGYLKYINLPARRGDNASMVRIELSQKIQETVTKKDVRKGKTKKDEGESVNKSAKSSSLSGSPAKAKHEQIENKGKGRKTIGNVLQKLSFRRKVPNQ